MAFTPLMFFFKCVPILTVVARGASACVSRRARKGSLGSHAIFRGQGVGRLGRLCGSAEVEHVLGGSWRAGGERAHVFGLRAGEFLSSICLALEALKKFATTTTTTTITTTTRSTYLLATKINFEFSTFYFG